MNNVVKLELVEMGENLRFDPDQTLEDAKGHDFVSLVILGELTDGSSFIAGNCNTGEALIVIERVKHSLLFGDD